MAITFVAKSAFASGTGALSVGAIAGTQAGDVVILTVHSANETITAPTNYTQVTDSPQGTGTAAVAGGVRCAVFYRVLTAADNSTTVADSGNVTCAIKTAYRGVDGINPINATAGSVQATATTAMVWPSVTTTADNCMIVLSCAQDMDVASTATSDTLVNANLTSITEQHDQTVTSGVGGGVVVNTGFKATAGSTGTSTSNSSTSVTHAYVTIALLPSDSFSGTMNKTLDPETLTGAGAMFVPTTPKVWDGSAWVAKIAYLRVVTAGGAWRPVVLKTWTGSTWKS